ncbi:MAG: T9SS type A sorting domain-containing protein [Bacteroidetes bacterium]|nr:T9SS type A sorting domain-containing protein [Bacteroidota bacterium]
MLKHAYFLMLLVVQLTCATVLHAQISSRYVCERRSAPFVSLAPTANAIFPDEITNFAGNVDLDDGLKHDIPLGFTFDFIGNAYSTVNVCTNGWVSLGPNAPTPTITNDCVNLFLPAGPNNVLAPYWGDHFVRTLADDSFGFRRTSIRYQTDMAADPNLNGEPGQFLHVFTLEWNTLNVNDKTDPLSTATFQLKIIQNPMAHDLTTPDNRAIIEFHYGPTGSAFHPAGCTVGIEDSIGSSFMNGLFPSTVANGDSTRLSHSRTTECWPPGSCVEGTVIVFTPRLSDASVSDGTGAQNIEGTTAFPNPCSSRTQIRYRLPNAGRSSLTVFDALGRAVVHKIRDASNPGPHSVAIDASTLSNGLYRYRIETGSAIVFGSFAVEK